MNVSVDNQWLTSFKDVSKHVDAEDFDARKINNILNIL